MMFKISNRSAKFHLFVTESLVMKNSITRLTYPFKYIHSTSTLFPTSAPSEQKIIFSINFFYTLNQIFYLKHRGAGKINISMARLLTVVAQKFGCT